MIIAYSIEAIVNEQNAEHNEQAEDVQPLVAHKLKYRFVCVFQTDKCGNPFNILKQKEK